MKRDPAKTWLFLLLFEYEREAARFPLLRRKKIYILKREEIVGIWT